MTIHPISRPVTPSCKIEGIPSSSRHVGPILALILIAAAPLLRVTTYFFRLGYRGRIGMTLHTRMDTLMFDCILALIYQTDVFVRARRVMLPAQ
jgi:hypothetical protein